MMMTIGKTTQVHQTIYSEESGLSDRGLKPGQKFGLGVPYDINADRF